MTDDDKKRIAEYMGWTKYPPECMGETVFFRDEIHGDIRWDLNAAALCIQEMQKRGEWWNFLRYANTSSAIGGMFPEQFIALLFNADNFFTAMAEWIKEGKK